jgi:transposase-like protein
MHTRMKTTRDERLALVREQENSGKPAAAFCRERGVGYQNFLRWKKTMVPARTPGSPAFVELALESPTPAVAVPPLAAELSLGGGIVLKVFAPPQSRP